METAVIALVVCFFIHLYFQERNKKKVAYVVHVQERTEEAETLDFAVNLYADESESMWKEKIYKTFQLSEERRKFNNDRIVEMQKQAQAEYDKMQAEKSNVTKLKNG